MVKLQWILCSLLLLVVDLSESLSACLRVRIDLEKKLQDSRLRNCMNEWRTRGRTLFPSLFPSPFFHMQNWIWSAWLMNQQFLHWMVCQRPLIPNPRDSYRALWLVFFAYLHLIAGTCEQQVVACLNEELTITCMTDSLVHDWTGTVLSCATYVTIASFDPVGTVYQCGNTSFEVLEGGSRLNVTADSSLDGATVVCIDAGGTVLIDVIINVIGKQNIASSRQGCGYLTLLTPLPYCVLYWYRRCFSEAQNNISTYLPLWIYCIHDR